LKDIIIVGAGGLGREVQWLIERINAVEETWNILGYVDDGVSPGTVVDGYKVIGNTDSLQEMDNSINIVCAIGSSKVRKKVINKIRDIGSFEFPNLIDPSVVISNRVSMGVGNVICAGTTVTVNVNLTDYVIVNPGCTIGHDIVMDEFVTIYPGANIAGNVHLCGCVEIGTGSQVIQGKTIGSNSIIGAGTVVVRDIPSNCTAVGVPAKIIKQH